MRHEHDTTTLTDDVKDKRPPLGWSLVPLAAMLVLLAVGYGVLGLAPEPLLILSAIIAGLVALRMGLSWEEMLLGIREKLDTAMPALLVLISIGILISTWMIAGTIPMMIYYGLGLISAQFIVLIAFPDLGQGGEGLVMVQESLVGNLGAWAAIALAVIMFLLAFTSVLGNFSYGEANVNFITRNKRVRTLFALAVTAVVFLGAVISVDLAWSLAGVTMVFIAMINLVVITILAPTALKLLRHYNAQRAQGLDPVFLATDMPEIKNIDCWTEEDVSDHLTQRGYQRKVSVSETE